MSARNGQSSYPIPSRKLRTGEHALKLVGVLETTGLLELRDHACLSLVTRADTVDETLAELGRVERLKHVLVLDVLEENHDLVERVLETLGFRHLVVLTQERIGVLRQQLWALGAARAGRRVTVDKLAACLVEGRDEASLSAERTVDRLGVLLVHLEQRVDVRLRVDVALACRADEFLNRVETSLLDMLLELAAQRLQPIGNTAEQSVHALQVLVLVVVEQVLEVFPHAF